MKRRGILRKFIVELNGLNSFQKNVALGESTYGYILIYKNIYEMRTLSIDLETYSSVDLVKAGVYAYTSVPDFEILLLAYAYDEEEVQLVDLASGEKIPVEVFHDLVKDEVTKTAFNAQFERTCLSRHLNMFLAPVSWQCTAVQSAMLGLPLSLEGVSQVLCLKQQKLKEGKDLMRYFSVP